MTSRDPNDFYMKRDKLGRRMYYTHHGNVRIAASHIHKDTVGQIEEKASDYRSDRDHVAANASVLPPVPASAPGTQANPLHTSALNPQTRPGNSVQIRSAPARNSLTRREIVETRVIPSRTGTARASTNSTRASSRVSQGSTLVGLEARMTDAERIFRDLFYSNPQNHNLSEIMAALAAVEEAEEAEEASRVPDVIPNLPKKPNKTEEPDDEPSEYPKAFGCPITHCMMKDPVVAPDGYSYERSAISKWISDGHKNSPLTRQPMMNKNLLPNFTLKEAIEDWMKEAKIQTKS